MGDAEVVCRGIKAAAAKGAVIDNLTARVIAAGWHSDARLFNSALLCLSSTGAILTDDALAEIAYNKRRLPAGEADTLLPELEALEVYVRHHGDRGRQPGWSKLHW